MGRNIHHSTARLIAQIERTLSNAEAELAQELAWRQKHITKLRNVITYLRFEDGSEDVQKIATALAHLQSDGQDKVDTSAISSNGRVGRVRRFDSYGDQMNWIRNLIAASPNGITPGEIKASAAHIGITIKNIYNPLHRMEAHHQIVREGRVYRPSLQLIEGLKKAS